MTGPEHYREGEELLALCGDIAEGTDQRANVAAEATAHFLAALVALHATEKEPDSITWQQAVRPAQRSTT